MNYFQKNLESKKYCVYTRKKGLVHWKAQKTDFQLLLQILLLSYIFTIVSSCGLPDRLTTCLFFQIFLHQYLHWYKFLPLVSLQYLSLSIRSADSIASSRCSLLLSALPPCLFDLLPSFSPYQEISKKTNLIFCFLCPLDQPIIF